MMSVLYIDDEPSLLDLCKHFLERTGEFSIETESSPQKALDTIRGSPYDAIISDYQMPGMDSMRL